MSLCFQGTAYDLRLIRGALQIAHPDIHIYAASDNQVSRWCLIHWPKDVTEGAVPLL